MAVAKVDSKLADKNQYPQIGNALAAITTPSAAGEDSANILAALSDILDALRYHGLIKE